MANPVRKMLNDFISSTLGVGITTLVDSVLVKDGIAGL
jgi:hypothetical protein